ncbi:ATP-dependent RNA helicase DDX54 [Cimex lectularius]|uniref:RNA helicase n=1 Tax=Cimex lectularius TaxID=79782 RepID=A0A8I6R6V3_CIMLE|nr:ATP-dependent RNA helicase DDX54 [Cimex lectularius]
MTAKEEPVVGFGDAETRDDTKKLTAKKSGGFENMGLSFPVLKGVRKRGYKVPTPIQRKTIPLVNVGRDVVAMARTGSGKTACFIVPILEKLQTHNKKSGIRAIILSPTRELASQTLRFVRELGKFTGLKSSIILGGDSLESNFSLMHDHPDIVVATPGRFLHLCVEMDLKLNDVQIVVFDEADRLFEMGFGEQLREIIQRLPETRQTLLFSATLPKVLVEFARAGLSDPILLRLDVETKIPDTLKLSFISCRSEEKPAVLKCLLRDFVKTDSLTMVFAATKHHVEYIHKLLEKSGIPNTFIYSDLHSTARKINVAKFQTKKVKVLIVTDIAARGIDIPHLDFVINYNFPSKPKLFVHRVGRCARAGREGRALCLVSSDEVCYMVDLHLFLGRPLTLVPPGIGLEDDGALGKVPQSVLDTELSEHDSWHAEGSDLASTRHVAENAYKQYIRSRPGASPASVKRAKEINLVSLGDHFLFRKVLTDDYKMREEMISGIGNYRPKGTVFEIGNSSTSEKYLVMKSKRKAHEMRVVEYKKKKEDKMAESIAVSNISSVKLELSNSEDIGSTFSKVILGKKSKDDRLNPSKKFKTTIDKENFISYRPLDQHTEAGLAINNFQKDVASAGLELTGDTESVMKSSKSTKVWDKKKKRMVEKVNDKKTMIKSESGAWIPASFKSGRYQQWVERSKVNTNQDESDEDENANSNVRRKQPNTHWAKHNRKMELKKKSLLKRPEQILKARQALEKKKNRHGRHKKKKGK